MKKLHANKDYVLNNGHLYILSNEEININDFISDKYTVWQWKDNSSLLGRKKIIASTDKSLPVKHIDRSLFVKPVNVGQIFDNSFDCYADTWQGDAESMHAGDVVLAMTKDKFVEVFNKTANPNQFTLEDMKNAICAAHHLGTQMGTFESTEDTILVKLIPISLPETIQCDDNYENLKPIWE